MTGQRCLLTGATGALGPAVAHHLTDRGYALRILSRDVNRARTIFPHATVVQGDVRDRQQVDRAVDGCEVVVHLAAFLHVNHPSATDLKLGEDINVNGTAAVVESARAHAVSRVVLASTIAVYGHGRGEILDEASVPHPDTPYGHSKLQAERLVLDAPGGDGRPLGVVLRLAAVYGPRVIGNYRRLVRALASGRFVPVGAGLNHRTLIYEGDVAEAIFLAATHPAAAGRVFNVSDGEYHTLRNIVLAICASLGRTPPRVALPLGPIRLAV